MLNKIKKKLANQEGMSTIEFAISFLVFIMLFSFIFDLSLITYKQYVVSEQATQMARQIAKQSGCENATPNNFPGGNANYYTQLELYKVMERKMSNLKIPNSDWKVVVKSKSSAGSSSTRQFTLSNNVNNKGIQTQYRDYITVQVTYNYTWGLWSQFIPTTAKGQTIVERSAFSEYNHNLNK